MDITLIRKNNLIALVKDAGSKAALGRAYGIDPTFVSQITNGHRNMGEKTARKIEKGGGLMPGYMDILHTGDSTTDGTSAKQSIEQAKIHGRVPVISWVSAGLFCEAIDNFQPGDADDWLPCPVNHSSNTYALKVVGDSMTAQHGSQRSYPEGTIIFVDPEREAINGSRVIVKLEESSEVTFKQLASDMGRSYLKPLNTQYSTIELPDTAIICGVVIGSFMPE